VFSRAHAAQKEQPVSLMKVTSILVAGDWATVEMVVVGGVALAGWVFNNNHCWVCRFDKVRRYLWPCSARRLEAKTGHPLCPSSLKLPWHALLQQGKIVEMRAYLDSARVVRLLGEADSANAP
jgi:ketosteroid isomerase-like protein